MYVNTSVYICAYVYVWTCVHLGSQVLTSHTGLLVATKKEPILPCWLHTLTQCGAGLQSTQQSHLVSALIWARLHQHLLWMPLPLLPSGHVWTPNIVLPTLGLFWLWSQKGGSITLQGAPAEGWVALLTWHLTHSICSYNLQPTSSLYGFIHSTYVHKHNTVISLNKGTAGENVLEQERRSTYQAHT